MLDRVKAALDDARARSLPEPGRNVLAAQLGISTSQARTALEKIRGKSPALPPPASQPVASPPASPTTTIAHHVAALTQAGDAPDPGDASPPAPQSPPDESPDPPTFATLATASVEPGLQPGARLVAWVGFAFGSVMSIAANVLHAWLPADKMPPGWWPGLAPQVGAAVWPIGLLISVEVLSRVTWRPGFLWGLARYGGAGTVAVGSGVISYGHLREVLVAWGYGHPGADVGPLVLDGLMVVCGFALLAMSPRQAGGVR